MFTTRLSLSDPQLDNPFERRATSDDSNMGNGPSMSMEMMIVDTEEPQARACTSSTSNAEDRMEIDPSGDEVERRTAASPPSKKAQRRSTRAGSVPARPRSQHGLCHQFRRMAVARVQFLRGSWIHSTRLFAPQRPNPRPVDHHQMDLHPGSSALHRGSTALRRSTRPALRHEPHPRQPFRERAQGR
jgi:hypothetical protein